MDDWTLGACCLAFERGNGMREEGLNNAVRPNTKCPMARDKMITGTDVKHEHDNTLSGR